MTTRILFAAGLLALIGQNLAYAQSPLRFKQTSEGSPPQLLSASEIATLGDPLFKLLLKDKANTVKLLEVMAAIQPNVANHHMFVLSESIVRSTPTGFRRAVLAFDGTNAGESLKGNVMLSTSFGPSGFRNDAEIEGWGWDNHRGRYNYYKLDPGGSAAGAMTWKFRGSSDVADLMTPAERAGTCMRCHVVGAPVMKELLFPWNNWHAGVGGSFKADYLDPRSAHTNKWPAVTTALFRRLSTADKLETDFLIPSFKRFDRSRLHATLKREDATGDLFVSPAGRMSVQEGGRLLRPLFETRDINLISSRHTSGFHPFGKPTDFVPALDIQIPGSFFLNTHLIAGGGTGGFGGLKLTEANQFSSFANLSQQENKDLAEKFKLRLNGVSGDTHFGWLVPEPGFVDSDLVDQALQLGVVTPHFVAAVLAVDVETPVFSSKRAELLKFVPDQFEFTPVAEGVDPVSVPRDVTKDLLSQAVISNIDQADPPPGTTPDEFRHLLTSANAVNDLQARVSDYVNRVKNALESTNPAPRKAELERLYALLIERRLLMRAHAVLKNLDETDGLLLFPLPGE
ncbi:MAG: hypothetical protein ACREV4_12455 [Gammaproteobacteria bacterium]